MHLSSCLHPLRIWNKYTSEYIYVPCGKCQACRERKSFEWTSRLESESRSWRYVAFVTLTYSDEHLPLLNRVGGYWIEDNHSHRDKSSRVLVYSDEDILASCSSDYLLRNLRWSSNVKSIGYLSVYDCQCFIKRLRKNLKNLVKSKYDEVVCSDYFVRYYLCGEYGSTLFRPHYHCLFFFNSQKESSVFEEALLKSWKFGRVDFSYVRNSASRYVAAYVNGFGNLPKVLLQSETRPFHLASKCPPIGSCVYKDEVLEEVFNTCSPKVFLDDFKKGERVLTPLLSCVKNRLFPRLAFYDQVPLSDRTSLYGIFNRYSETSACCNVADFVYQVEFCYDHGITNNLVTSAVRRYLDLYFRYNERERFKFYNFLMKLYYLSSRFCCQSVMYDISVIDYVSKIDLFYENVKKVKLQEYFDFSVAYSEKYNGDTLCCLDFNFIDVITHTCLEDLSYHEIELMKSYGIDIDKWFCDDCAEYRSNFIPYNTKEFLEFKENTQCIFNKLVKNKKKNEYLNTLDDVKRLIADF